MNADRIEPSPPDRGSRLDRALADFLTPKRIPATPRDEVLLAMGERIDLDDGLVARSWGEGPTVLLVHGWESRGTHWAAHIEPLTGLGFRAVAVDAPGHGESSGERCHVVELAARLVGVTGRVGPLAGVVAHSFGAGATVLALARGLKAGRVALISGPASLAGVVERWGRAHGLPEPEGSALLDRVERAIGEPVLGLDLLRIVAGLATPALIVHDRGDEDVPFGDGLALAAAWPGAKWLATERYGHRRILIARDVARAVAAFLADRDP